MLTLLVCQDNPVLAVQVEAEEEADCMGMDQMERQEVLEVVEVLERQMKITEMGIKVVML